MSRILTASLLPRNPAALCWVGPSVLTTGRGASAPLPTCQHLSGKSRNLKNVPPHPAEEVRCRYKQSMWLVFVKCSQSSKTDKHFIHTSQSSWQPYDVHMITLPGSPSRKLSPGIWHKTLGLNGRAPDLSLVSALVFDLNHCPTLSLEKLALQIAESWLSLKRRQFGLNQNKNAPWVWITGLRTPGSSQPQLPAQLQVQKD